MQGPQQHTDPRDTKNLLVAISLSLLVIFGWQAFVEAPRQERELAIREAALAQAEQDLAPARAAAENAPLPEVTTPKTREEILASGPRLKINTPDLHGSISLTGGRIDDLTLARYRETVEASSPEITLLSPSGTENPYYAEFGWRGEGFVTPDQSTVWQTSGSALTPETPVTLTWANGQGLVFERVIAVDDKFMFTVTQTVRNEGTAVVALRPYGLVSRTADPAQDSIYLQHEGPIGVLGGVLEEDEYVEIVQKGLVTRTTTGGWFGFTDKYWLVALAPDQASAVDVRVMNTKQVADNRFQTDYVGPAMTITPGASQSVTTHFFAGAKEARVLDGYISSIGIPSFDLAIDFGWFYFLTKPFFYALDFLARLFGNFGFAILAFTVVVKLLLFPLADKSYVSMAKMKVIAPRVKELRDTYAQDPQRMSQEMMALYKKEGVHPLSGCWPVLIQIPIFFALYKVLYVSIEMRHVAFAWMKDLSGPDPSNVFTLFGLLNWSPPSALHLGALPIAMGLSMWLQMRMNPPPTDPAQKMVFGMMPWIFMLTMGGFPAGLIMYWTWSNILSIIQQFVILRRMHVRTFD